MRSPNTIPHRRDTRERNLLPLTARNRNSRPKGQPAPAADTDDKPESTAGKPNGPKLAWTSARAVAVFLIITILGLMADLWTKHAAFDALTDRPDLAELAHYRKSAAESYVRRNPEQYDHLAEPHYVLSAMRLERELFWDIRLKLQTNPGIVFGLPVPRPIVAVATVLTMGLVAYFFATSPAAWHLVHVALAFILGGALGNLYDRLFAVVRIPNLDPIRYQVRDFIDFSEWGYKWVFNIADVLLVVGVALLMLHWLVNAWKTHKTAESG
ncbi:MAG: signal peptidase II [Phycisphaerae bacterium]